MRALDDLRRQYGFRLVTMAVAEVAPSGAIGRYALKLIRKAIVRRIATEEAERLGIGSCTRGRADG